MNILILFSQPWRVGGAETHVEALLKGLTGNKLFLAINEGSDLTRVKMLKENFPEVTLLTIQSRGMNLFRWQKDIAKLSALIKTEKIDIISAQQRTAGLWAYVLHRNSRIPYTVTMHDPWHRAMFKSIYAKTFPQMFAVSQNLADQLVREFDFAKEKIKVINNGIDFTAFAPKSKEECRKKIGFAQKDKIILHVSRLSKVKGAVSLAVIESMEAVLQEQPKTKLIIIGEGPLRADINEKISSFNQQFGDAISIYDFVDNLVDWYNAADILVGEGRVAIEALACLKPVVAIRNTNTFIGVICADNISYACDVNFDGKDKNVTPENIAQEIKTAFSLNLAESKEIADYIRGRLSIEKMTTDYLNIFKPME